MAARKRARPRVQNVTLESGRVVRLVPALDRTIYPKDAGHSGGLPLARIADKGDSPDGECAVLESLNGTTLGVLYRWSDGRWTTQRITGRRDVDGKPWHELSSALLGADTRIGAIERLIGF